MPKDYLLMFLEKRIFTLKAGDDSLLDKLRAAVGAVTEKISSEPRLVVPFALIALDPLAPIDDPVFETVAAAVQDKWNTYTEVFPEPRSVFRAVLLDALAKTAENDVNVAGGVDLVCRNLLPHIESGGETEIVTKFRNRMREIAHVEAENQWPSDAEVSIPKAPTIKFGQVSGKSVSINRDTFKSGFPMPQIQNNWNDIRSLHAMIAGPGADNIAAVIESAVAAGGISAEDLKKNLTDPMLKGLNDLIGSVATSLTSAKAPLTTLKRQSDLLWWKESAYSEHLQRSYRTVSTTLIPLVYALDFAKLLPRWSPLATEHFLAEAILAYSSSTGSKAKKNTLLSYLEKLSDDPDAKGLLDAITVELPNTAGRYTLLAFTADVVAKKVDAKQSLVKTGMSPELIVSDVDICLNYFREVQALRLLSEDEAGDSK
ncbi:MAG TPA: GTPase-associated system all-helical protein GASH [Candidatus Angelobacter sp.]|nr:GTPase-associated system all-helical protein GASH [Candidatus Angelobacter sp.]